MNGTTIHAPAPVDMRDIRALRNDLVEVAEEASRQTLAAHRRTLDVIAENEARAAEHRREIQGELAQMRAQQKTMLGHLERLVVVPANEVLPAGVVYEPSPLVRRLSRVFGSHPSTTRLLLAATIAAALAGSLSACAAFGAAHAHMIGALP
jgi:hypothetical protein